MKSCSRGKTLSKGSVHSWAGGETAGLSPRCAGSSQQLPVLLAKPLLPKEVLFCFCCYTSKATYAKPKSFPCASIDLEETTSKLHKECTLPYRLQHHPTAAAAQAKPGGQQQWSLLRRSRERQEGQDRTMNSSRMKKHSMSEAAAYV